MTSVEKLNDLVNRFQTNKFFKIGAGEKLRTLISKDQLLLSLDDFGDA